MQYLRGKDRMEEVWTILKAAPSDAETLISPDDWWTDGPDYVDSWYTLARTDNGTRYGARGNGWMALEPYFVQEL